jgi:hypothetical protein
MQPWNIARAAGYGVAIGLVAAAVKLFNPWSVSWAEPHAPAAVVTEFAAAGLGFALLCAGAAALRNAMLRHLLSLDA